VTAGPQVNGLALERELNRNPAVIQGLEKMGKAIARDAAILAPKRTGFGAKSIDYELDFDVDGAHVRVSWDKRHFYMSFHEFGTSDQHATPFLRPAAAVSRTL
jgi:HK97 gp10 family phage protein